MLAASISPALTIVLAIFGSAVAAVLAAVVLTWLTGRQHHADKEQEWERQDLVAQRAEEAAVAAREVASNVAAATVAQAEQAKGAQIQAAEAAALLLDANERVAAGTQTVSDKLDVIHTLVDGNITTALASELGATSRELAMMKEVRDLKRAAGLEPTPESIGAIASTEAKIVELTVALNDRLEQQKIVERQVAGQAAQAAAK